MEGLKAQLRLIHIDPSPVEQGTIFPHAAVYSPLKGYVTKQDLVLGQFIEPDETVLELIDPDQLLLQLNLFENDLNDLAVGQTVNYFKPDNPEHIYRARLTHLGKSIDPVSRTVLCLAEIRPEDRSQFVNHLFVEASIITCQRETLAIPDQALIEEAGKYFLLILAEENEDLMIFHKTLVQVGVIQRDFAEILDEGLHGILLEGVYNLVMPD